MYIRSTQALLDSLMDIDAMKVYMLLGIDELLKTHKLANELHFLLDVRECKILTMCDLVAVKSFESLM